MPPGGAFTLRFAQAAAGDAHLDWGGLLNSMQRLTVLGLTGVRVQRLDGSERVYACGAKARDVAWGGEDVKRLPCQPTLNLQRLELTAERRRPEHHRLGLRDRGWRLARVQLEEGAGKSGGEQPRRARRPTPS